MGGGSGVGGTYLYSKIIQNCVEKKEMNIFDVLIKLVIFEHNQFIEKNGITFEA